MLENLLMDFRFAELVDDEDETVVSASSWWSFFFNLPPNLKRAINLMLLLVNKRGKKNLYKFSSRENVDGKFHKKQQIEEKK